MIIQLLIVEAFFTNGLYAEYFLVIFVPLFMLLPTLGWLRTVAEHREYKYIDCSSVILRNFKSDFIGFFLGAAGFKDHDLHHMYSGVSYKDFELLTIKKNPVRLEPASYSKVLMQMIVCRDKP